MPTRCPPWCFPSLVSGGRRGARRSARRGGRRAGVLVPWPVGPLSPHSVDVRVQGLEPQTLACHAPPLGSVTFTQVQEVPFCKAFGPRVFAAVRCDPEYLPTER